MGQKEKWPYYVRKKILNMTCFQDKCSVCLKILGKAKITLPCGHSFHIQCGTKWLIGTVTPSPSCPDCRHQLSEEDDFVAKSENVFPPPVIHHADEYSSTFAVGTREQIHRFLIRKGGNGISDDEWELLHSQLFLRCFVENDKLVLNYYELYMLAVFNGCQGDVLVTEMDWHSLNVHNNWDEEVGVDIIHDENEEIDDGGSERHFPFY